MCLWQLAEWWLGECPTSLLVLMWCLLSAHGQLSRWHSSHMDYSVPSAWHFPGYCLLTPLMSPKRLKMSIDWLIVNTLNLCPVSTAVAVTPLFLVGSCSWPSTALYSQLFEASAIYVVLWLLPAKQDYSSSLLGWEYPQDYICCTGFEQLGV